MKQRTMNNKFMLVLKKSQAVSLKWISMSAKFANTSMIPKKGTQIQGLHLELPLRICRITGSVLSATFPKKCLKS